MFLSRNAHAGLFLNRGDFRHLDIVEARYGPLCIKRKHNSTAHHAKCPSLSNSNVIKVILLFPILSPLPSPSLITLLLHYPIQIPNISISSLHCFLFARLPPKLTSLSSAQIWQLLATPARPAQCALRELQPGRRGALAHRQREPEASRRIWVCRRGRGDAVTGIQDCNTEFEVCLI